MTAEHLRAATINVRGIGKGHDASRRTNGAGAASGLSPSFLKRLARTAVTTRSR
jgi:hypothetical protein